MASTPEQPKLTVSEAIDLYFNCANGFSQWYSLYKYGELEDCSRHWQNLKHTIAGKTKYADHVQPAEPMPCKWTLRTPEEATAFWEKQYPSQ